MGGAWQTATPLPVPVNSLEAQDMNPCIANDGRTLWFRSDRTGQNQIYTSVDTTVLSIAPRESSRERIEGRQGLQVCERGEGFLSILLLSSVARQTNTVVLCDILGRTIVEQPVHFSLQEGVTTGRLLVGELPAGTYIISVRLRDQTLSAKYISLK